MTWNFDLSQAPKGSHTPVDIKYPDGSVRVRENFNQVLVWTASKCGKVILSYYLPKEDRWNLYTKGSPPIAWQEFVKPTYPEEGLNVQI